MPVTQEGLLLTLAVQRMRCVCLKGCVMKSEKHQDTEEVMEDGPSGANLYRSAAEDAYKIAKGSSGKLKNVMGRLGDALMDVVSVLEELRAGGDYEVYN